MNGKPDPQRCRFCEHYDPHGSTNVSWRYPWVCCTSVCKLKPKRIHDTTGVFFYHVSPYQKACDKFSPGEQR